MDNGERGLQVTFQYDNRDGEGETGTRSTEVLREAANNADIQNHDDQTCVHSTFNKNPLQPPRDSEGRSTHV